jgi:hypothetical protein
MKLSKALLLVGSAKVSGASTSESLGRYLIDRLERNGVTTLFQPVNRSAGGKSTELLAALADADLFILATPLYVDSFPYLVIRTLEGIEEARAYGPTPRPCALATIINCGFPEAAQCETALAMAKLFARRARFEWAGGLALGQGTAIDGKPLEALGGLTRHVRAALDLAATALTDGQSLPAEAIAEMARPLMPSRLYTLAGNFGWRRQASRNQVHGRIGARPFDR